MANFASLLKNALVAIVLVAVVGSGAVAEKLASCCKTVSRQEITEPITGYMVQAASPPCVNAVIFQTESGLFCSYVHARWVRSKIVAFEKAKAKAATPSAAPSSTASLLSIITSTASPSSSSSATLSSSSSSSPSSSFTLLSSSSSFTSKMPPAEAFTESSTE